MTNFAGKILQRSTISWTICPIPIRPFDYIVKAGNRPAATPLQEEDSADSKEENNA